jgi:hypothetical protein
LEERYTIQLNALESISYMVDEDERLNGANEFILDFKDGRSLFFKIEESSQDIYERNDWVQNIEDSHECLQNNPIPVWTIV